MTTALSMWPAGGGRWRSAEALIVTGLAGYRWAEMRPDGSVALIDAGPDLTVALVTSLSPGDRVELQCGDETATFTVPVHLNG